jgi:hypothetical protein
MIVASVVAVMTYAPSLAAIVSYAHVERPVIDLSLLTRLTLHPLGAFCRVHVQALRETVDAVIGLLKSME